MIHNGIKWTIWSKWTISANGGLGLLLEMVLELDIRWRVSEDAGPPRGWIMETPHRLERVRNISYTGVETSL